ncbi:hypothetical protein Btru_054821 [Bulinus truncatus]|nr:hypothetical protein Btru_054821 [Bulinus truncatus]
MAEIFYRYIFQDITQQQLTNVQVAELLEKCTRFHIVCSERLCEEDMMTFDAKINNENLTKCLQTLKEIYADLEKKQIFCPNEAEFRGYMVLMNLNEGDTLREIQQLRSEIRASVSINFAVKAYNALNANNYVRFFRLIKQSSFLNACILHRYFNQMRGTALIIIMKALNAVNKNKVMYPIQELTRLLCFEDDSEAKDFCSYYNLNVEGNDVIMDSRAYLKPEASLPQRRSKSLVEAKLTTSLGEAINGSPLPQLHLPTPSSSFDQDGTFVTTSDIQEALATSGLFGPRHALLPEVPEDQVNIKDETVPNSRQVIDDREMTLRIPAEVKKEKIAASNDVIKSLARTLILEVIDNSILEMATSVVAEHSVLLTEVHSVVDEVTADIIRFDCKKVLDEEERQLRKVIEEESKKQKEQVMSTLCDELVHSTVDVIVKEIACEEMKSVKSKLLELSKESVILAYSQDILSAVVDEFIADISHDVYEVDVVAKNERLKATAKCVQLMTCRKFFQCWKSLFLAKIKMKNSMLDFPSAPPTSDQINKLVSTRKDSRISENSFYINERAKLSIASPMEIIQQQLFLTTHLTMASARKMLASLMMWHPLDLSSLLGPLLNTTLKSWLVEQIIDADTFQPEWKLLVSLPDQQSSEAEIFLKWIKAKLCKNNNRDKILETRPNYEGHILTLYHINESHDRASSLGICVRCFHGHWTDTQEIDIKKKGLLDGTSAVLFVTSKAEDLTSQNLQELTWKKDKKRLHQVLLQKRKCPTLPLVIIIPRLSGTSLVMMPEVDHGLELSHLYKQNLISAVHLAEPFVGTQEQLLENYEEWTSQLTNCIKFAVNNIPIPPKLRAKPVSDFVEDAVVEFFKAPVYQDLRTRSKHQKLHQSPNSLLTLYNAVIEHVSMVAASDTLTDVSWPSPEFDQSSSTSRRNVTSTWNSEDHMCNLYELIGKMRLPYFPYSDLDTADWYTVCQDIWSYINSLTKKDSGSAKQCLFQQVANLLSRVKKNFDQFCWLSEECGPCEPTYVNMAWTDLIDACIHYRLVSLRTGHVSIRKPEKEEAEEDETEESDEPCVYYIEAEFEDWQAPEVWLDALRDTEQSENGQIKSTILKAKTLKEESLLEERNKTLTTTQTTTQPAARCSAKWEALRDQYEQERILNSKFEQTLESILASSDECQAELNSRHPLAPFVVAVTPVVRHQPQLGSIRGRQFLSSTPNSKRGQYFPHTQHSHPLDPSVPEPSSRNNSLHSEKSVSQAKDLSATLADQLSTPSLNDKMNELQNLIQSQKETNVLFELNLKRLLDQ